jgi:hypothetical protein
MLSGYDTTLTDSVDVLTGAGGLPDIWDAVATFSYTLRPFCYAIIGFVILIELARTMMSTDMIKWEMAFKVGIKLALARVCIDLAPTLLHAFYLQATAWTAAAGAASLGAGGGSLGTQAANHMSDIVRVMGTWEVFALTMSLLIPLLAVKICGLLINVIAYARLFEIYVLLAISPLPMAFFPLGDGNGGGFSRVTGRFLRSFAAVCLQSVMIILCIKIFYAIVSAAIDAMYDNAAALGEAGVSDFAYALLLGAVVLVIAVFKSGSWAKQILDAA